MDLRRVGKWQWLTGLMGLVLFIDLFLPWFGAGGLTATAWQSFAFIDLLLALTALAAMALVIVTATQSAAALPKRYAGVLRWFGLACTLLVIYRLLKLPDADITLTGGATEITRKVGLVLGAIVALALTVFAWLSAKDARFPGPLREHPQVETLPPPTAEEPARRR